MEIKTLFHGIELLNQGSLPPLDVSSISYDSRQVKQGTLFVAIQGTTSDGHQFISQAIEQGAVALLCEKKAEDIEYPVPCFIVKDSRVALSKLSANFYHSPAQSMKVVGITGTNGKTTISYLMEAILQEAGFSATVIGTINFRHAGKIFPATHTTPESLDLNRFISERQQEKSDALVMEVSSHAIDQHRVDDLDFDVCVFSNLTPDHLDYHQNLENYFEAKAKLFRKILPESRKKNPWAILNIDDPWVAKLKKEIKVSCFAISLSADKGADFYPLSKKITVEGIEAEIQSPDGRFFLKSPLMGEFNLSNLLCAIAAGKALGISFEKTQQALSQFKSVPGRLERVDNSQNIHVFVDYAHSPDALKNVLKTFKQVIGTSKIITVFGCGGDRDKTKRPLMGAEVAKLSDFAVLTSDNPRTEKPESILEDVRPGLKSLGWKENEKFWVEVDRKKAIGLALSKAEPGDVVLIAGKGHEDYQILGKEKIHFDDREVAREYLQ